MDQHHWNWIGSSPDVNTSSRFIDFLSYGAKGEYLWLVSSSDLHVSHIGWLVQTFWQGNLLRLPVKQEVPDSGNVIPCLFFDKPLWQDVEKEVFFIKSSWDFWYLRISRNATVPGRYLLGFFTPPRLILFPIINPALVSSPFLGILPPVLFKASCFERAIVLLLFFFWFLFPEK